MARQKDAAQPVPSSPYRVRSKDGRAVLDFGPRDNRTRVALQLPFFEDERSSPAERRAAHEAAEAKFVELTNGRVLGRDPTVLTAMTFAELYGNYVDQFEPEQGDDENARRRKMADLINRRAYGRSIVEWANDEALRDDGTKRWRRDPRTPLQRLCAPDGPTDYLLFRLTKVTRITMRKEKSNLARFLLWSKAKGYLARVPEVTLPAGKGVSALTSGRGVDLGLTGEETRRIVAVMPEWSSKPSRKKGLVNPGRFLVRPFFEFMWITGLRPVTVMRFIAGAGLSWEPGQNFMRITDADDKAEYGRRFPLSPAAVAILEKYAPTSGHIFGHHDFRTHVERAAKLVLDEHRAKLFGSYHLRHFVGTFLASRTTNTAAGMFLMGHTEESTFSGYVHPREAEARVLVDRTDKERERISRSAEKWAERRLREAQADKERGGANVH